MQNGKGSKWRKTDFKKYFHEFDKIEFREKGTYCEDCGRNLRKPFDKQHKLTGTDGKTIFWVCKANPYEECNYN